MKTNKLLVASAAATMMMTGLTTNAYAVGATGKSEATVNFSIPNGSVPVKDPTAPEKDMVRDTDGGTVDNADSAGLSLDYVTNLDFGQNHSIEGTQQTYQTITPEPFIQVSDRRGTGAGWKVTVEATNFMDAAGNPSLLSSTLKFTNGKAKDAAGSLEPEVKDVEIVTGGSSQTLVTAEKTSSTLANAEGLGTWIMSWLSSENPKPSIELTVPANAASKGTHTADITWTLTSGV